MNMNNASIVLKFISVSVMLLFASVLRSNAQVDSVTVQKVSIINAKKKVEGIYRTFDEFRRNDPFYKDSFEVVRARNEYDKYFVHAYYDEFIVPNKNKEAVEYRCSKFFGYCANDTVYVSFFNLHRIEEMGHLSLIWVTEPPRNYHPILGVGLSEWKTRIYVLDYMNGDKYPITDWTLIDKLELWDPELYKRYVKSENRRKFYNLREFVKAFNQRNPIRF